MKTKIIFSALALAMLLATACNKNESAIEESNEKGYTLPVTINVTREGDDATKATFNDGTKKLSFSAGDKLFVKGYYDDWNKRFAGTLGYDAVSGKFSGTIATSSEYTGTADDLLSAADDCEATLLPAGYEDYGFLEIGGTGYDASVNQHFTYTLATSKAAAVEQFSCETAYFYSGGFALAPENAILNFTITGFAASTNVAVALTYSWYYNVTKTVTTDSDGKAVFGAGVMHGTDLNNLSLTVGGNAITLVNSSNPLDAGHIYNITRAVTPPTLAQTMNTADMTVKVKYNYQNQNYCLFSSNGDGTYTFQSGSGFAGGDENDAKALVVEGGKLVFKQNLFDTIDDLWSIWGFSVTFDTSNNTYIQWFGESNYFNPSFISVEVNSVPIALTQKITVADLVKEDGQYWSDIISNNPGKIQADGYNVVRVSDNAKLQRNMFGDDWQDVSIYDDYQPMFTYKFEGD